MLLLRSPGYLSNEEVSKYGIATSSVAKEIGFQDGDKIISVNGKKITRFRDVAQSMNVLFGSEIAVLRGCDTMKITIPKNAYKRVMQEGSTFFSEYNYPVILDSVLENTIAHRMGLLAKDHILQINADTIYSFNRLQNILYSHRNEDIQCFVARDTSSVMLQATLDSTGKLGVLVHFPYQSTNYTLGTALAYGYRDAMDFLKANAKGIGKLFTGEEKATESIQGPIGMAQIYGAKWVWSRFWYVTGILSLIFAFMNFLPIPALDGGHILFTVWEIVTRRKPSDQFLTVAQNIGMILLIALMVFAFGNDLFKVFR
jgi:regulator of sigma E protease